MKKHEGKYGSCGVPAKICVKQNVLNVSKEMSANCPNKFSKNDQHEMQNAGTDYQVKNRQFTENQLDILEEAYSQWPLPDQDVLIELVKETNIKGEEIVSWYEKKNATKVEESFNKLFVIKDAIETTQANDNGNFVVEVQNLNNTNVKRKNVSSNIDETILKKRPHHKLSEIEKLKKVQGNGNVKIRPEHEKKKQGSMKSTSSQNIKTSSNESPIKCELCTEFFQSLRELFVHMMAHVPSGIMARLPEGDEERGWCPHCPGPVPVEQVESHMAKFHREVKMGGISSDLDPDEILEDGLELEDAECDEWNLKVEKIPDLMVECRPIAVEYYTIPDLMERPPVFLKYFPEYSTEYIVNLADYKPDNIM